jgi:hypothetical protein
MQSEMEDYPLIFNTAKAVNCGKSKCNQPVKVIRYLSISKY